MKIKKIKGQVNIPYSKSYLHRYLLICLACQEKMEINVDEITLKNKDIQSTFNLLKTTMCKLSYDKKTNKLIVDCRNPYYNGEKININASASTLRISMLIFLSLFGVVNYKCDKELIKRPLEYYNELFKNYNIKMLVNYDDFEINVQASKENINKLINDNLKIDYVESSQYISALMIVKSIFSKQKNNINIKNGIQSSGYLLITQNVLEHFGIFIKTNTNNLNLINELNFLDQSINKNNLSFNLPNDLSCGLYWIICNQLGSQIKIETNFDYQPDLSIIKQINENQLTFDFINAPDAFPIMVIYAILKNEEIKFINIERNIIKESNRIYAMLEPLQKMEINFSLYIDNQKIKDNNLKILKEKNIYQKKIEIIFKPNHKFKKIKINGYKDHRIIMSFAILNLLTGLNLEINDKHYVNKSYSNFWEDYNKVGDLIE